MDVGSHLDCRDAPTVPGPLFPEAEFASLPADHVLVSGALTERVRSHTVFTDAAEADCSDHLPVLVEIDL